MRRLLNCHTIFRSAAAAPQVQYFTRKILNLYRELSVVSTIQRHFNNTTTPFKKGELVTCEFEMFLLAPRGRWAAGVGDGALLAELHIELL